MLMNVTNNQEMMQFYLTNIETNLTMKELKEHFSKIFLSTDDIVQDINAIDEEGRRVSILKTAERNQVSSSLG